MKKQLLFSASLFLAATTLTVAQITDAGFENWTVGAPCSDLNDWSTANSTTGQLGNVCTATQETADPYSGSSAVTLTTILLQFATSPVPGVVTNGTIDIISETVSGGQAFTERPTSFSGWYQGAPVATDNYSFTALLINENTGDTVGTAAFNSTATVSTWTQFTAPVAYSSPDNPTIVQITLLSSDQTNPIEGSVAKFDDLSYETLTVGLNETERSLMKAYPNPVVNDVYFELGKVEQAAVALYNIIGVRVMEANLTGTNNRLDTSSLPSGTYIWQMASLDGEPLKSGKLQVAK